MGMIEGKTAKVRDVLAPDGGTRTHSVVSAFEQDGKTPKSIKAYQLSADKETEMPLAHAMQFLKDVSFVVTDEAGNRITPLPINKDGGVGGMKLEPGETIAHLTELTTTALLKRCKADPYSVNIDTESSREAMIEFLMSTTTRDVGGANLEVEAQFAATGGQMSQKEIAKMFGDD